MLPTLIYLSTGLVAVTAIAALMLVLRGGKDSSSR